MNVLNFNSEQCARIRRHLDAYLSNELLVETTSDVLRHLESCGACSRELEARTRVRDALRRVAVSQNPPEELRQSIQRQLRQRQPGFSGGPRRLTWALALALVVVLGVIATEQWIGLSRGRRVVASVLALGVSDHLQCAIKGHNYPDIANPPEQLRQKLGPQYAGLLEVVQQKLPGFEILEAHICSVQGSPRKYVHFITRGRGTILSVMLTKREGAQLPNGKAFRSGASGSVNLYEAHLEGMNAAGFESMGYFGFVVSDLSQALTVQIASELAPPLKAALDASSGSEARLDKGRPTILPFRFDRWLREFCWRAPLGLKAVSLGYIDCPSGAQQRGTNRGRERDARATSAFDFCGWHFDDLLRLHRAALLLILPTLQSFL